MALRVGDRLGHYDVLGPLGVGGMGDVYRAHDVELNRDVALKVLADIPAENAKAVARFKREATALAALSHPNLIAIHDIGQGEGTFYAVMELLEGATLRQRLIDGAMPVREAVEIAREISSGLAAVHKKGIVHRDLKPENLFVTSDGRVKILDFGLAKLGPALDPNGPRLEGTTASTTTPGSVLGMVGYMAPEQIRGEPGDARSDIFSLGCVLYEMLSGRRAFTGNTPAEMLNAIAEGEPPAISTANDPLLPKLESIVRRSLEKKAGRRFKDASEFLSALQAVEASELPSPRAAFAAQVRPARFVPRFQNDPKERRLFFRTATTLVAMTILPTFLFSAWPPVRVPIEGIVAAAAAVLLLLYEAFKNGRQAPVVTAGLLAVAAILSYEAVLALRVLGWPLR